MQLFVFSGCCGTWSVAIESNVEVDRETAWLTAIPKQLSDPRMVHREYIAAGIGTRSADGVRCRITRLGGIRTDAKVIFTPTQQPGAHVVVPDRLSHFRQMRMAVEAHWKTVYVLIGALFASWRSFKLASAVLSMESQSARDLAGHIRRHRARTMDNVALPRFSNIANFTPNLIKWARERIPMGSCVALPAIVCDDLAQARHLRCPFQH